MFQVGLEDYVWAAAVATDLVNTAPEVWYGTEQLPHTTALSTFLAERGLISVDVVDADLPDVHALRERLRLVLESADAHEAAALTSTVAGGLALDDAGRWTATTRVDVGAPGRLRLAAAVGVLGTLRVLGPDRFRACAAEGCLGLFIDTSKPGRRRFCMPERCGNRQHVANHRARQRG